jgi:hypothetical protein
LCISDVPEVAIAYFSRKAQGEDARGGIIMAIVFLPSQPVESAELMLSIDSDLIDAVKRWRGAHAPQLGTGEAIEQLLRQALASEGVIAPAGADEQMDALLAVFREAAGRKPD